MGMKLLQFSDKFVEYMGNAVQFISFVSEHQHVHSHTGRFNKSSKLSKSGAYQARYSKNYHFVHHYSVSARFLRGDLLGSVECDVKKKTSWLTLFAHSEFVNDSIRAI